LYAFGVDLVDEFLPAVEAADGDVVGFGEEGFEAADIFEEAAIHQGFLIQFDWDLRDFEDEFEEEHGDFADFAVEGSEEVPDFGGGGADEVEVLHFVLLIPDELLPLDVVVLAQQLQELEGPSIGTHARFGVDFLVGGLRFEDVLPVCVAFAELIEIVVVDGGGGELVLAVRVYFF
jgi:hypothetical protein